MLPTLLRKIAVLAAVGFVLAGAAAGPALAEEAPAAAEEKARKTSEVHFFGHIFGHTLDSPMPANTQFPTGEDNYGLGSYDFCTPHGYAAGLPPVDINPGVDCDDDPNNKLVFFSTAGFVQVSSGSEFEGGGGYVQLHNERGSTKDIVLDTTGAISAVLYLSQDAHAWSVNRGETYCIGGVNPRDTPCLYPYWGWDPGFAPAFSVEASLYYAVLGEYGSAASDMPPIREALESGSATLVAKGATPPEQLMNGLPGMENVHRFDIDLGAPQVGAIPKEANFFLVYSFYQTAPDGSKYSLPTWRIWSGEFFPPSFTLPVKNAFDVEAVLPQFVHGKVAILGVINTPWGSYDVDPKATRLTIADSTGKEIAPERMEVLADYAVAHGAHYKPVNVTFVWDYQGDKLAAGTYTVTVSAANHQRSASAICEAKFTILEGGRPGSVEPGFCGLQTDTQFQSQEGDPDAPAAAGGGADGESVGVPPLPVIGLAGLALLGRRRS